MKPFNNSADYEKLEHILLNIPVLMNILEKARMLKMEDYYIGAGCIAQLVWNRFSGFEDLNGIKDIDFVYYDGVRTSEYSEKMLSAKVKELYSDIALEVDVINEARVHIWYSQEFGYDIKPYESVEEAIKTWPTTATAIGIRLEKNGRLKIYAPFGIADLLEMIIRPNKTQITEDIYMNKVKRWIKIWPKLSVVNW